MNRRTTSVGIVVWILVSLFLLSIFSKNMKVDISVDPSELDQKLAEIEYKSDSEATTSDLYQANIFKIVIHHTATPYDQSTQKLFNAIQKDHWLRRERWWIMKQGQKMMYHRLIGSDWFLYGDKDFNEIWRGTRENNVWVIHIALQGNFNEKAPTDQQYETLSQMINTLRQRYWTGIQVIGHWQLEKEHTACPWKLFDWARLTALITPKPAPVVDIINQTKEITQKVKDWYVLFSLSRYYSPVVWQKRYYNWRTYLEDVKMNCWLNKDWTPWDCFHPASWITYSMSNKNKSVACGKQYPIWTRFELDIDWSKVIVTCEDRWSAIVENRLDMYCGIWDYALDNWNTCITGKRMWKKL